MRLIIEARLADEDCDVVDDDGAVIVIGRRDRSLSQLGLTLAEGRSLLARLQSVLVAKQVAGWSSGQMHCRRCGAALSHKDSRSTVLRTVYGKVTVWSPRLWSCACRQTSSSPRQVIHPLSKALPGRVTPELEYLQAKWAAHLPYRQATDMLKEVLPLDKGISFSGTRDGVIVRIARNLAADPAGKNYKWVGLCMRMSSAPWQARPPGNCELARYSTCCA